MNYFKTIRLRLELYSIMMKKKNFEVGYFSFLNVQNVKIQGLKNKFYLPHSEFL